MLKHQLLMDASALAFVGEALSPPGSSLGVLAVSPVSLRRLTGPRAAAAAALIDNLGAASAAAQNLASPITTAARFSSAAAEAEAQILYVICSGRTALGFCKTGRRILFLPLPGARGWREVSALCVLDIFVDAASRRRGVGRVLFDSMLMHESSRVSTIPAPPPPTRPGRIGSAAATLSPASPGSRIHPCTLAYDRPSVMLLGFLRKHYGLDASAATSIHNFVFFGGFGEPVPLLGPADISMHRDDAGTSSEHKSLVGADATGTARDASRSAVAFPSDVSAIGPSRGGAGAGSVRDFGASTAWAGAMPSARPLSTAAVPRGAVAARPAATGGGGGVSASEFGVSSGGVSGSEFRSISSWGARAAPFATSFDAEGAASSASAREVGSLRYAGRPHLPVVPSRTQGF